jgi:hypothetical protein
MKTGGSALFMTLIVVSIVVMFVTALVAVNQNLFGFTKRTNDRAAALALAKAGINRLVDRVTYQDAYAADLNYGTPQSGYSITFNTADPNRSVNNLFSDGVSATTNYQGDQVPARTADIVVVARSNGVERRFRFILKRGLAFQGAMAANRRIIFGQDIELKSITSLHDDQPVETKFHANDYGNDGTGVTWDGSGSFTVGAGCEVSSASLVAPSISGLLSPDEFSQNVPAVPVPSLDIDQIVADNSGAPPPTVLPVGGFHCDDNRYLSSTTTVIGDISLYDGSLYVQGDLNIKGGVVGYGSIYVTGDVNIEGGNASVITNQPSGAAVLAGGDISFNALSAEGFIDELALIDTDVANAWNDFKGAYEVLDQIADVSNDGSYTRPSAFNGNLNPVTATYAFPDGIPFGYLGPPQSPKLRADDIHAVGFNLSRGTPLGGEIPIGLPGPIPTDLARWGTNSFSRKLHEAVNAAAPADPRTEQVSRAIEHVAFYFRHNWWPTNYWDDNPLPPNGGFAFTSDRQLWIVHGGGSDNVDTVPHPTVTFTPDQMALGMRDYFRYHDPLNFGWLGRAYFQGLLYAKGDVTVVNRTEVIGTVISGGDLSVADGASFTYNKEYDELTQNLSGPVKVVSFREL